MSSPSVSNTGSPSPLDSTVTVTDVGAGASSLELEVYAYYADGSRICLDVARLEKGGSDNLLSAKIQDVWYRVHGDFVQTDSDDEKRFKALRAISLTLGSAEGSGVDDTIQVAQVTNAASKQGIKELFQMLVAHDLPGMSKEQFLLGEIEQNRPDSSSLRRPLEVKDTGLQDVKKRRLTDKELDEIFKLATNGTTREKKKAKARFEAAQKYVDGVKESLKGKCEQLELELKDQSKQTNEQEKKKIQEKIALLKARVKEFEEIDWFAIAWHTSHIASTETKQQLQLARDTEKKVKEYLRAQKKFGIRERFKDKEEIENYAREVGDLAMHDLEGYLTRMAQSNRHAMKGRCIEEFLVSVMTSFRDQDSAGETVQLEAEAENSKRLKALEDHPKLLQRNLHASDKAFSDCPMREAFASGLSAAAQVLKTQYPAPLVDGYLPENENKSVPACLTNDADRLERVNELMKQDPPTPLEKEQFKKDFEKIENDFQMARSLLPENDPLNAQILYIHDLKENIDKRVKAMKKRIFSIEPPSSHPADLERTRRELQRIEGLMLRIKRDVQEFNRRILKWTASNTPPPIAPLNDSTTH